MKKSLFGKSLALFALTTGLGVAAPFFVQGPARLGAGTGVVVGAIASASALGLLALAFDRGLKLVLGALVVGFLLRMMLVAAGVLVAHVLGGDLLAFAATFFALYLAHQIIELAVVVRHARPQAAEGQA
ncbi:MAG: hypothetical protein QM765_50975 [Myxococcales bacterium]